MLYSSSFWLVLRNVSFRLATTVTRESYSAARVAYPLYGALDSCSRRSTEHLYRSLAVVDTFSLSLREAFRDYKQRVVVLGPSNARR